MAPEQISLAPVDARADLYSTGAVIYEMLSGRKIFDISPNAELNVYKEKILKDKVPPLNEKDLPMEMSNFVVKLIEKNPKNRFQSANEAIIALTQITEKYPSLTDNNKSNPTHSSSSSAMLEDIIRLFLVDGNMSSAERKELDRRAERLGLSQSQSRILEEKVRATIGLPSLINIEKYQKTVEKYLESAQDLVLNSDQIVELEEMRKKSKIKEDDAETILKIAIDRIEYRRRLENRRFKI
jgi:serine/threonine protein kinase